MLVYIAGPLYTEKQRLFLEKVDQLCKDLRFETFLPHRDAGLWDTEDHKILFQKDKEALDKSQLVVAVLYEEDNGTAWEIGYAYAHKIPLVVLGDPNTADIMIKESSTFVISLGDLKHELAQKAREG